jgi:hypothetical protein
VGSQGGVRIRNAEIGHRKTMFYLNAAEKGGGSQERLLFACKLMWEFPHYNAWLLLARSELPPIDWKHCAREAAELGTAVDWTRKSFC